MLESDKQPQLGAPFKITFTISMPTFLQSNENENRELFVYLKSVLNQAPTQNFVPLGLHASCSMVLAGLIEHPIDSQITDGDKQYIYHLLAD